MRDSGWRQEVYANPIWVMENFVVHPLTEGDLDTILANAGGRRAHPDADRRRKESADYLLGDAVIELKCLNEEGLDKRERQQKLASLFRNPEDDRPVVVIDRDRLPAGKQRQYDAVMRGPIKSAVNAASGQLKQSRSESLATTTSILFVVNNGYGALDHKALVKLVADRARNDTRSIDGVVVAGCYFHRDTFDSFFLWPIEYVPINLQRPFTSFERLREAWDEHANDFMTAVIRGDLASRNAKGPVKDLRFDMDGVTYIKPAPPLGRASPYFVQGRPRSNSSGIERCPPVATMFPDIRRDEWGLFCKEPGKTEIRYESYRALQADRGRAAASETKLRPFVPIAISYEGWRQWKKNRSADRSSSVAAFANNVFETRIREILFAARERSRSSILPARYVLAVTEEIGQDRANDVSQIFVVAQSPGQEPTTRAIVRNARIFHEHALALASAYAIAQGIECVMWERDQRYGWT